MSTGGRSEKRPTVRDLAKHAGVSVATVSRVLNDSYTAPADTRRKVMDAVQRLGYRAPTTRALTSLTGTVGIGMPYMHSAYFLQAASGIEEQAAAEDVAILVGTTGLSHDRELAFVDVMVQRGANAVILLGGTVASTEHETALAERADALMRDGARLVLCGRPWEGPADAPVWSVYIDSEDAAFTATTYLLSCGHRRIGFIGGPEQHVNFSRREAGYRRALTKFGVPFDPALVSSGPIGREEGVRRGTELLTGTDVSAIFAINDETAVGVLAAARSLGRRVPQDLSVMGFDDVPIARDLHPALTTVHVPQVEIGRLAGRLALRASAVTAQERHVRVGTHIVVRDSVDVCRA